MGCTSLFTFALTFLIYGGEFDATQMGTSFILKSSKTNVVTIWRLNDEQTAYCMKPAEKG